MAMSRWYERVRSQHNYFQVIWSTVLPTLLIFVVVLLVPVLCELLGVA